MDRFGTGSPYSLRQRLKEDLVGPIGTNDQGETPGVTRTQVKLDFTLLVKKRNPVPTIPAS